MFIAIMTKGIESEGVVQRAAFTSADKDAAIRQALSLRSESERKGQGPYRVFVGELLTEVVQPVQYSETPIKK